VSLTYRLIGPSGLDSTLVRRWHEIRASDPAYDSPYFCPEFSQAVGRVRDDVRIAIAERDNRPVGFFPHQRSFAGMGRPVGGPFSDYHGVIVERGVEWDMESMMQTAGLSVWAFDHLAGPIDQFNGSIRGRAASPQIDLSLGFEHFAKERREAGSDFIRKTQGLARKLEREVGALRFVLHEPAALVQVIQWKSAQYRRTNPSGVDLVFSRAWTSALLREIVDTQTEEFSGVCSALYAGDKLVAAHMGMRSRHHLHYWFPAYDPGVSKYSPGSILLLRLAEAALENKLHVIDLGKGDSQYKRALTNRSVLLAEGAYERPSVLSLARQLGRAAEAGAAGGGAIGALMHLPVRAARRLERLRRFR